MTPRVEVRDISVRFDDRTVLDRVHLAVPAGATVALLGPSGSGKSTLLRVIAGLLPPDAGEVLIDGNDVTRTPTHRRGVGVVFQDEQLFPHRTVGENVGFGLRMQRVSRAHIDERVDDLLGLVGLSGFAPRSVENLSGGEAKRVALARSLAPRPKVLLLDEPLTGLDTDLHDRLVADIRHLLVETGTTAVHVTHDRAEAARIADRVVHVADLVGEPRPHG